MINSEGINKEDNMSETQRDEVKTRPVKRFRSGRVSVAQFENKFQNEDGERTSRMYSPQKSYKVGEEWKTSNSYSLKDLIHLRGIIDQIVSSAYQVTEQNVVTETEVASGAAAADVAGESVDVSDES
jgi:hypothetical protein